MSRVLIDISDEKLKMLDELASSQTTQPTSRASLVRLAIDEFLEKKRKLKVKDAFGILKHKKLNALKIQRELRSEW
jgi:hypothetical protein